MGLNHCFPSCACVGYVGFLGREGGGVVGEGLCRGSLF